MNDDTLKEQLIADAMLGGICKQGLSEMQADDLDALVDYYVRNPDWCMERNYPTLSFLRRMKAELGEDFLERHGVYIDREFTGQTMNSQACIFHHCTGLVNVEMDYGNAVIPMLYFANRCEMEIECRQRNNPRIQVPAYIFGYNIVDFDNEAGAQFKIYNENLK